jgi:ribosomal protein L11 methyltransferase
MSTAVEPRFPFVLVDTTADDADAVSASLFELGAQGVEERDATTLVKARTPGAVTLVASFATEEEAAQAIAELPAELKPAIEHIVGDAWRDAWKEHFRPFALCEGLAVRPPWETYVAKPGEHVLELEPGRAFGTGLHETTSLVAGVLADRRIELAGKTVLDVGTGSGILALVALRFGAKHARCTDNDPDVVDVVRENAVRNQFSDAVEVDTCDVSALTEQYPWVLANIEAGVLIPMAKALSARVAKGGTLVLSGILHYQKDEVVAAYQHGPMTLKSAPQKGEWIALEFVCAP